MDNQTIYSRLHRLTSTLKPAKETSVDQLHQLQRSLAEQLIKNPDLAISGNRLHHESIDDDIKESTLIDRFGHLSDLFSKKEFEKENEPEPLIFKRETSFANNFIGNSVPLWGNGMAPSVSYGPFIDENGLSVWFDFFFRIKTVSVYFQGNANPVLLIPVRGILTANKSYQIQAGSIWIASNLIAKTSQLQGYYTGLKIKGGKIDFGSNVTINNGSIIIQSTNTASLNVELDQNTVDSPSTEAGFDATKAIINLPSNLSLQFNSFNSSIGASNASATVFGSTVGFDFNQQPAQWIPFLSQILIPYKVVSRGNEPDTFYIEQCNSKLCNLSDHAKLDTNSGWLLPAAQINPAQLGSASGTGALCISLQKGLQCKWKGLSGGVTKLNKPAIIAEPGMLTVIDFFAENVYGKQKWILWQNENSKHHSRIDIGFGKIFPFVFISSSKGTESTLYFCNYKASFDRPVKASGSPFKIESVIGFAGITQTGAKFNATIYDNDLLFDGNPQKASAYQKYSIALRNAFFTTTAPYSLFLHGELTTDNEIAKGAVALMFGIYNYLPTLPDPYVASYTARIRGREGKLAASLRLALACFIKWPDRGDVLQQQDSKNNQAYIYFRFAPLNIVVPSANNVFVNTDTTSKHLAPRNFKTGVNTFNQNLSEQTLSQAMEFSIPTDQSLSPTVSTENNSWIATARQAMYMGELDEPINELKNNPLLSHIPDKQAQVMAAIHGAIESQEQSTDNNKMFARANIAGDRIPDFAPDSFMLLDVSSNADQMGVSFGEAIRVDRDQYGTVNLSRVNNDAATVSSAFTDAMPLQILNMDVVSNGLRLRAVTLPQVSWEPVFNIPLAVEGGPDFLDTITVTPGIVIYDNDGIATRIFSESPYPVPIAPLPVTKHFIKEFNDEHRPRHLHSCFTLPFGIVSWASFKKKGTTFNDEDDAKLNLHMPQFDQLRGGLQIKALAPKAASLYESNAFEGRTIQIDNNIKWFLYGIPLTGSTLGKNVKDIFNGIFYYNQPKVPLEKIDFSGYGASIFSNWLNKAAAVADVSQSRFDVITGRTGQEIVQVRSVMYMCTGIVHVVRTITLTRSANGYVFRSDSGWQPESNAFYDCDYNIDFKDGNPSIKITNPYEFHPGIIKGVSNVRNIKDYPAGGTFDASFSLNQSGLPAKTTTDINKWKKIFGQINSLNDQLKVNLQAVVFDGDVHMDNVTSGGQLNSPGTDFRVQSRKMLGYIQLAPTAILIPPNVFASLLNSQNGSVGGPVDCVVDLAGSKQKMRLNRVDLSPATDASGNTIFASAGRGSLILPQDGAWSTVKQHLDTGDIKPVEQGQSVPVIKRNGNNNIKLANPADVINEAASKISYGVLQSTGTQKLFFDVPQFNGSAQKLFSKETYFADAYKLLNSKGVFPNIANALKLTNAEKEIQVIGEGLMKMADRELDLNLLLPSNYQYAFIDKPGILRVYAEYSSNQGGGKLKLGIDSAAALADKWKAALSNIKVVVDLGPFNRLMWVDGNFKASSGISAKYDKPELQFGPILKPVIDILRVLATLSGDGFDEGMNVGMSNSPDNWEYKFNCSKEIPVIRFPSAEQLTINPNPPLKLEAGLKVGFYFNELLSIPSDLKQLVPACGAYVEFYGRLQVQCFTLGVASIYAVGQAVLGIQADSKAGLYLYMKVGFGVEIVVGLPVVANVAVLYMAEVEVGIGTSSLDVGALMLFRGSAEICGGLVAICIQIEAGGGIHRDLATDRTSCVAQVTFSIDVCVLWVIDIEYTESWKETRQLA